MLHIAILGAGNIAGKMHLVGNALLRNVCANRGLQLAVAASKTCRLELN